MSGPGPQWVKASRLVRDGRCWVLSTTPGVCWVGVIQGDTDDYLVTVSNPGRLPEPLRERKPPWASCTCHLARQLDLCPHVLAACSLLGLTEAGP